MITNNEFDRKIKDQLDNNLPSLVNKQLIWSQIETQLNKEKTVKKNFLFRYLIAASLMVLLVLYSILPHRQSNLIMSEKRWPIPKTEKKHLPIVANKCNDLIAPKQKTTKTKAATLAPIPIPTVEEIELEPIKDRDSAVVNLQIASETPVQPSTNEQPTSALEIVTVEVRYASPNSTKQNKKLLVDINNLLIGTDEEIPKTQLVNQTVENKSRLRINNFLNAQK